MYRCELRVIDVTLGVPNGSNYLLLCEYTQLRLTLPVYGLSFLWFYFIDRSIKRCFATLAKS